MIASLAVGEEGEDVVDGGVAGVAVAAVADEEQEEAEASEVEVEEEEADFVADQDDFKPTIYFIKNSELNLVQNFPTYLIYM